jgi:hypothetical protein
MAEAAIMSVNVSNGKRTKVIVAPSVNPQYRQTLRTYTAGWAGRRSPAMKTPRQGCPNCWRGWTARPPA